MDKKYFGDGKVVLLSGGGKVYTDIAARFVSSEEDLEAIIGSEYSKELVRKIISCGHLSAAEFDNFIFGIEGYSRVTETQLVRKRHASYMVKESRTNKQGKRKFSVVLPKDIGDFAAHVTIDTSRIILSDGRVLDELIEDPTVTLLADADHILETIEQWYNFGVELDKQEDHLRYLKPQATEFRALILMNAHALIDWFRIRCCNKAGDEIKDLAFKMLKLCKEAVPDLFEDAGPSCVYYGYCPENELQHPNCVGKVRTRKTAVQLLKINNNVA